MEPISLGLLMALVGGASGEMGKQAWTSLTELVRRPFHRSATVGHPGDLDTTKTGEAELTALEHAPDNAVIAEALSQALAQRAAHDPDFRAGLQAWHDHAHLVSIANQNTDAHVVVRDATFNAPTVLGRDFSGPIYLSGSSTNVVDDRFNRALEQLSHDRPEVRLGGVHVLAEIAAAAPDKRPAIAQILSASLRNETPITKNRDDSPAYMLHLLTPLNVREPVAQQILTVLGNGQFTKPVLSHTCLLRANLASSYLFEADLRKADLRGADLTMADLRKADLRQADLTAANLTGQGSPELS
jgi:hypothetical protein